MDSLRNRCTRPVQIPISANSRECMLHSCRWLELMQTFHLSIFISIYMINRDASSSVHHYIDGAEEHLSPSEHALGFVIELYTCVFIPVRFLPCWTDPRLSPVLPTTAPSPINVRLSEEVGSRRRLFRCSAQPCVCNHSGCCSADWCSCVGPCCRWVISSPGYTSLPLINCPINPAGEWIMHS